MSERLRAAQLLIQRAVGLEQAEPANVLARAAEGLAIDARDRAALAASDPRRLYVYRKLVRGTLREAVRLEMPRTAARLGDRYGEEVAAFCHAELPRSPILRDVAFEFAAWAAPRWARHPALPPWLADLARYELLQFDVYAAERVVAEASRGAPSAGELSADQAVCFDGSVRLGAFGFAVQELPEELAPASEPRAEATRLCGYRDADNEYRELTLTPLAFAMLAHLTALEPLGAAVRAACAELGETIGQEIVDGASRLLADLAERGMVLGACAPGAAAPASPWAEWLQHGVAAPTAKM